MATIAEGVEFDKIAREWRCKWSPDDDKKSLVEAQKALESILSDVKSVDGVMSVERIVCGGCLDFKVVTTLGADDFGKWEEKEFAPESDFIKKLEAIDGLTFVETQTYTVRYNTSIVHGLAPAALFPTRNFLSLVLSLASFRKCPSKFWDTSTTLREKREL